MIINNLELAAKLFRVAALEERSLSSEGWLWVGAFEHGDYQAKCYRHPNGNRAKVVITPFYVELYINNRLKKVYE